MFFSNKAKEQECELLKSKIQELEAKLQEVEQKSKNEIQKLASDYDKKLASVELEKLNLTRIASFSTNEGLVALDNNNNILFMNDRAKENIKNTNNLLEIVSKEGGRIIIEDCEAKLEYKKYDNLKVVSLVKTSIHDNADDGLLHKF